MKVSTLKKKMLLLLFAGIDFGYAVTPGRQWKVLKNTADAWRDINEKKLRDEIRKLYQSKLISRKENPDGSYTIILTEKGRMKTLTYYFEKMKIEKEKWDGKWRIVTFDIPEKKRGGRDAFRGKIKEIGFHEFQKSVWIYPYKCKDEIDFIIECYFLRKYVRFGVLESIDNEIHLKKIFDLN